MPSEHNYFLLHRRRRGCSFDPCPLGSHAAFDLASNTWQQVSWLSLIDKFLRSFWLSTCIKIP
jgi:hypothetical protein